MTTTPRIYVACLASYNAGRLHGLWIDATDDVDAMQAEINRMLAASPEPNVQRQIYVDEDGAEHWVDASTPADKIPEDWKPQGESFPSAEEWAIHDSEGLGNIGEYAGLAAVARLVSIIDLADDRNIPAGVLMAYADDYMSGDNWDASDLASQLDDNFDGSAESWEAFTESRFEDMGGLEGVPESIQPYIDFERMGRDWELSGDWSAYRDSDAGELYFFRTC